MIAIPLVLLIVLALIAVAWSPIFALVIAVPAFIAFLVYVGMQPRADETVPPRTGEPETRSEERTHGIWGEREA